MVGDIFRLLLRGRYLGDMDVLAFAAWLDSLSELANKETAMKTKVTVEKKVVLWCVYLDINLNPQWCAANSREAKALASCPEYIVGCYSKRGDKQAAEDAAITGELLRRLQEAA